jgi:predicted MPP superfamily phosphohydrolase
MLPWDAVVILVLISALPVASALILISFIVRRITRRTVSGAATPWFERRWLVRSAAGLLALYAIALAYGSWVEPDWVELTRTEIPVRQPVLGQERFRIVQLSDLHLKTFGRRERCVVKLARDAKPDLIVLTGDYLSGGHESVALLELLHALEAPFGIYGVNGNNDEDSITRTLFRSSSVRLLVDEVVSIQRENRRLRLVGQNEPPRIPLREILGDPNDAAVTILLRHKPEGVDELNRLDPGQRVDLFLCGHTHGGQICLPFWGAIVTESKYHKKYERGLYDVNGVPMYVNRGIGTTGIPVRFLARPEVAIIDLVYQRK